MVSRAFIVGVSGHALTGEERAFLREQAPWGFILFKRNVETPAQVARLVEELRAAVDRLDPESAHGPGLGRVESAAATLG